MLPGCGGVLQRGGDGATGGPGGHAGPTPAQGSSASTHPSAQQAPGGRQGAGECVTCGPNPAPLQSSGCTAMGAGAGAGRRRLARHQQRLGCRACTGGGARTGRRRRQLQRQQHRHRDWDGRLAQARTAARAAAYQCYLYVIPIVCACPYLTRMPAPPPPSFVCSFLTPLPPPPAAGPHSAAAAAVPAVLHQRQGPEGTAVPSHRGRWGPAWTSGLRLWNIPVHICCGSLYRGLCCCYMHALHSMPSPSRIPTSCTPHLVSPPPPHPSRLTPPHPRPQVQQPKGAQRAAQPRRAVLPVPPAAGGQ